MRRRIHAYEEEDTCIELLISKLECLQKCMCRRQEKTKPLL
jgi:hypothetical protein